MDFEICKKYGKASISEKSPSQLCCLEDHFSLNFEVGSMLDVDMQGIDELFIETKIFGEYERDYNRIVQQFRTRQNLFFVDANLFAKALISIKYRNIFLLKSMTDTQLRTIIKGVVVDIRRKILNNELLPTENFTSRDLIDYLDYWEDNAYKNEDLNRQLFLSTLVVRYHNPNDLINKISNDLLRYTWNILIADVSNTFITTDNPGYCIDRNGSMTNMNFFDYKFYFPLTPLLCIMITDKEIDWNYINNPVTKDIRYSFVNRSTIDQINYFSRFNINQYLISHSKQALNTYFLNRNRSPI